MNKETRTTETDNKPVLTGDLVVEARIAYALDAIEEAQNKLYDACRAVSSIIGFAPECLSAKPSAMQGARLKTFGSKSMPHKLVSDRS